MLVYVMFDVSTATCMAGWIEIKNGWNCNKFISHFKQLYHSDISVFYYVHWIGLCTEIVLFLYMDN